MDHALLASRAQAVGFDWAVLVQQFGPLLAEMILRVMEERMKRRQQHGALALDLGGFDISHMFGAMMNQYGQKLIATWAAELEAKGDDESVVLAGLLRTGGPYLLKKLLALMQGESFIAALTASIATN